jgi:virginiamycin A acetyltransferase
VSRLFNSLILRLARRDEYESLFLRKYFERRFDVSVGLYSYGCFDPSRIGRGVRVGRYCSFAPNSHIYTRNHGVGFVSSHPYFYNSLLGFPVKRDVPYSRCLIEDDVWFGHGSVVLPSVNHIGRGAIIGAGSVVTKDIPAYAIVGGNPAKILRQRFPDSVVSCIEESQWWNMNKSELGEFVKEHEDWFFVPSVNSPSRVGVRS